MTEKSPWPTWARYTATAAMAFGGGVVAFTVAFSDIKHDAATAKKITEDHESRIRTLEDGRADVRALKDQMGEVRADVKILLQRTSPK